MTEQRIHRSIRAHDIYSFRHVWIVCVLANEILATWNIFCISLLKCEIQTVSHFLSEMPGKSTPSRDKNTVFWLENLNLRYNIEPLGIKNCVYSNVTTACLITTNSSAQNSDVVMSRVWHIDILWRGGQHFVVVWWKCVVRFSAAPLLQSLSNSLGKIAQLLLKVIVVTDMAILHFPRATKRRAVLALARSEAIIPHGFLHPGKGHSACIAESEVARPPFWVMV
jgi:hypothetical protein